MREAKVGNIAFLRARDEEFLAQVNAELEERLSLKTSSGEICDLLAIHHDTFNKMLRFFIPEGKKEFDWSLENCRTRIEEMKPNLFVPTTKTSRLGIVYDSSLEAFEAFLETVCWDKSGNRWFFRSKEARERLESYQKTR